jgi:hypothetical protein
MGREYAIMYAVTLSAMAVGARAVGPVVAHRAPLIVAVLAAAAVTGLLVILTARALKIPNAWVRSAIVAGGTGALFFALHQIG